MTWFQACQREPYALIAQVAGLGYPARVAGPIQLHLVLSYKIEVREVPRVRDYLDRGYRIAELQRVSDREVVVTLTDE